MLFKRREIRMKWLIEKMLIFLLTSVFIGALAYFVAFWATSEMGYHDRVSKIAIFSANIVGYEQMAAYDHIDWHGRAVVGSDIEGQEVVICGKAAWQWGFLMLFLPGFLPALLVIMADAFLTRRWRRP